MEKMHTAEPWKVSGTENIVAGGNYVVALDCKPEDALRIVACVNACAGIPTDQLESVSGKLAISSSVSMWQSYCDKKMQLEDAIEQRDELLAACETYMTYGVGEATYYAIRDAIASVKGGAE